MPTKAELSYQVASLEAEIAKLRARDTTPCRTPILAEVEIRKLIHHPEQESFVALYLDARQRVILSALVSVGSLSHVDVHPREIFRDAIRIGAHSIIVGHNHPSGDLSPSDADVEITKRLVDVGRLVGIPVLDHLIVATPGQCVSLASLGCLG